MKKLFLFLVFCSAIGLAPAIQAAPAKAQSVTLKWPTFRRNASKKTVPEVAAIQYLLRARGFYPKKPDGVFGAQTAASMRAFQRKNGLKADGIVAAQTFPKLMLRLKRGDRGDAVRAFQMLLKNTPSPHDGPGAYADLKVDGNFGLETESYLRNYQALRRDLGEIPYFKADGVVGALTWCDLFGGII